ncbi:MAG: c-type cytochrome [Conexibacter sp.]
MDAEARARSSSRRWALGTCAALMLLAGCGGSGDEGAGTTAKTVKQPTPAEQARQARLVKLGRGVFFEHCHSCHSILGRKHTAKVIETPAPDFDEVELKDPAYLRHRVLLGGFDMQSFQGELSEREIDGVIAYVSATAGRNVDNAAADAAPPDELATGEDLFRANCESCHTIERRERTGKPTWPGTSFDDVKPSAAFVRQQVRDGIPETMPAFRNRLTEVQIRALATYVTSVAAEDGRPYVEPQP